MATPAQRYAAAAERARLRRTHLTAFLGLYEFDLDPFQVRACQALEAGRGVLVAAPTGSGKTVVGEFAIHLALALGRKCFYTTPIKALSNQKYRDLVDRYGEGSIGLLTGDTTINGDAPIVVMTTEVLRNMLYAQSSAIADLGYVVMDEVHYLADRFRGAVWEEVIIHLPASVTVAALSATVSNAEEFGAWLEAVRGDTDVIVEEHRPVPLWQHVIAGSQLLDLFIDPEQQVVNPQLVRLARDDVQQGRGRGRGPSRAHRRGSSLTPYRSEVVERLERDGLLPAITFIFSRAACDDAVRQCVAAGLRLTAPDERSRIRSIVLERTRTLADEDLLALGYQEWVEGLERGIAAHHAGLLPLFKEVVETCFQEGLLKVVFATETLALGINMPARSVVLERLVKWNGESHVELTPGEYTQLTGRAGRRGIDVEGHGVVIWHPGLDPRALAGLASTRTYPLRSSFRPSYNMAVNLVSQMGRHRAREVLETSFAQFQADRSVVGLATSVRRLEEAADGYREAMQCHLGDFGTYAQLRERISQREKELTRTAAARRKEAAEASLKALRPGDVILVPGGRRAGPAVVIDQGGYREDPRPLVLNQDRQVRRISTVEITSAVEPIARVRIPKGFSPRNPADRRSLAAALREVTGDAVVGRRREPRGAGDDAVIVELRASMRQHPCHGCSDREQHARWAERYHRARREIADLEQRVERRTNSIARQFDRVCEVLADLGYLTSAGDSAEVTDAGRRLMRLYAEADVLAAEVLRQRAWEDLDPPALAAAASTLVYESRSTDEGFAPRLPRGPFRVALERMQECWNEIRLVEERHGVPAGRGLDPGFAWSAYRWASGASLRAVLEESDITAGDFVRWARQVIDVLGQIAQSADEPVRSVAMESISRLTRGVVASTAGP
ncbi:MAG: DEAD/DEAH box helicase [Actinomycetales bacterium]|nr:DEAD/DEAH box helicase [Actinomycetales bacterium]